MFAVPTTTKLYRRMNIAVYHFPAIVRKRKTFSNSRYISVICIRLFVIAESICAVTKSIQL